MNSMEPWYNLLYIKIRKILEIIFLIIRNSFFIIYIYKVYIEIFFIQIVYLLNKQIIIIYNILLLL